MKRLALCAGALAVAGLAACGVASLTAARPAVSTAAGGAAPRVATSAGPARVTPATVAPTGAGPQVLGIAAASSAAPAGRVGAGPVSAGPGASATASNRATPPVPTASKVLTAQGDSAAKADPAANSAVARRGAGLKLLGIGSPAVRIAPARRPAHAAAVAASAAAGASAGGVGLPAHVFAPYFETFDNYSPALASVQSGARYLTFAFLQTPRRGSCSVVWNGDPGTPVSHADYGADIARIRARGGDVIASFGGYAADHDGTDIADSCHSVRRIAAAYERVVRVYGLHRIDLDVEADSLYRPAGLARRSAAIARVQAWARAQHRPLQVSLTLGATPNGLSGTGEWVVRDADRQHMRVDVVNLMTFDYDDGRAHNMLHDAETAATGTVHQLAGIWHRPADSLWDRVGITQMVGHDDYAESFRPRQAVALRRWAAERGVNTLSFWVLQRDSCPARDSCSGLAEPRWSYSRALDGFTSRA